MVKRYYAGGQQVAAQTSDGTVSYHLNDPTGTSLVLVDGNGDEDGRILYDSFGMVMENTLSAELTSALLDVPNAATGLVHLGDGRWYDPALGRPLQPNPAGGPPTVPQALNRYAATPVGQPGVAQAAQGDAFNWTPSAISFVYGSVTQLAGHTSKLVGYSNYTANLLISATASQSALTRNWNKIDKSVTAAFSDAAFAFKEGTQDFYARSGVIPLAGKSIEDVYKATDNIVGGIRGALPRNGRWAARITSQLDNVVGQPQYQLYKQLNNWESTITGIGAGIDFAVGFQLHNDWGSPYLTSNQVWGRGIIAGGGSAASGILGGAAGGAALGALCGPGIVICSPIGAVLGSVGGGLFWSEVLQPRIFQAPLLRPEDRNLLPLN
jgi:hypothetical protein